MQIEQSPTDWEKKWSSMEISYSVLNSIIKIQRLFRAQKFKKKTKKNKKYRKDIIEELIRTEETYISDLSLIICDYQFPLKHQKIITQEEDIKIFGSIQEIKKVNEQFYVTLYNKFSKLHDCLMIFDEEILRLVPYFKLYFQYIQGYESALKLVKNLQETNSKFKKFLSQKQYDPKYRGLQIDSFLIKPIQRLPKYVILLKDLVKHTPDWHPYYENIIKFLQTIQKVNSHNNQSMSQVLNDLKIQQLQKNLDIQLIQNGRKFIYQQSVNILVNNKIRDALMYLFTDLILLTHKSNKLQKVLNVIVLSRGSFCKDINDFTYYKNLFSVTGNQGKVSTFVCSTQVQKQKLMNQIRLVLESLNQKQFEKALILMNNKIHNESIINKISQAAFQVQIDVLGTQQRNQFSITKYTIYIVQVKIKNVKYKIFVRFKLLLGVQQYIIKTYPQLLSQTQLLVKTNWFKNHQNKVIEERKLQIQQFLQSILSMKTIRENGGEVLSRLGLPDDFYCLPEKMKNISINQSFSKKSIRQSHVGSLNKRISARSYFEQLDNSSSEDDSQQQLTFKSSKQRNKKYTSPPRGSKNLTAQQLLYANQMILGHFTRLSVNQKRKSSQITQIQVSIMIPSEKLVYKQLILKIDKTTRIQHLTILVSNKLGLKYYKDFRFVLKQRTNISRILDDDEIIQNIIGLSPTVTKVFKSTTQIYFQKFIYIHHDLEQRQIKGDRVRLILLSNQALIEIKQYRFRLQYQDYLVFVSLYMILNGHDPKDPYLKQIIKSILPEQVFVQLETDYWVQDVGKCHEIMMQQLKTIYEKIKVMKTQLRVSAILEDIDSQHASDFVSIVRLSIVSQVQKHFLYGTCIQIVQISEHIQDYLRSLNPENSVSLTRNMWLGIKYDKIMLISANLSQVLISLKYEQLQQIRCEPHCIRISTQSLVFKLKTTRSYFISQLIQYYQKYMQLYEKIDKDRKYSSTVISRARQQMRSVIMNDIQGDSISESTQKFSLRKQSY